MNNDYLDFEQPLAELEAKISELRNVSDDNAMNIDDEIHRLEEKLKHKTEQIFSNLSDWQISQLARHPKRPYTKDYIKLLMTTFDELHGDRAFADDPAIIGGLAEFRGKPVMVIGHQKGRSTKEKIRRNFGMPRPEGYRKALRLMKMAERFGIPILTFIDTPGAHPGISAEERGQNDAIARNLSVMSDLKVPIISTVIGEGGSGGALAIGVGDCTMMLEYSTYSVISPEGCASILWRSAEKASEAAEALSITSKKLKKLKLIDKIIEEPLGSAHKDIEKVAESMGDQIEKELEKLQNTDINELLERRYARLMSYGVFNDSEH
ncbi:MAG TPA: acetyl-CoA carboxylase carboxyltransferase subunit alpha [Gammaproteobacteria bacterium]|nr:acetyl-CoA carboxylase carboxyltransferase subunit alpha [Xanthomonadales bacterium]MCB1594420.1 acetyl-CoA carboxylase carboxyltransferase subunit alpha [Xanthomonadales bacterium]HOP22830.1 acetyl-CoA carboxylase carboxyltransferase subunit alpha [Gammaproteobacteria bacterium]HPI96561.1 acetyl-CoA carboxylase carboxyltransferase subunit alpha [Gammaproteobacteria bacterium]HPQ87984.1 acetyl-CoA carboxylase carboxyltransferase subunit alpha [Gammaproteobacteria bacterium]